VWPAWRGVVIMVRSEVAAVAETVAETKILPLTITSLMSSLVP